MNSRERRKISIHKKVKGTSVKPRISVFRSNRHISAQLIDDGNNITLLSASDQEIKTEGKTKTKIAIEVGGLLGKKIKEKKISEVVFDRSGYRYMGRVKGLAEGIRKQGIKF